jgi:hypothetical protein
MCDDPPHFAPGHPVSAKRPPAASSARATNNSSPPSRSPCSPILSKRRPRLVQPPCVVGANYLGQAASTAIKFSDVPADSRDSLLEQSISACLRADDRCRVSAASTITVAGERLEIATHAEPKLIVTWLKSNTAYCGRCDKYPRCFGIIRSLITGVFCEVFASETEEEVGSQVVAMMFPLFLNHSCWINLFDLC